MEGFSINQIEMVDDKKSPALAELLTGEIVKGLSSNSPVSPTAELEKNEWIQFPDSTVQKVVGETHEKGGVKMNIPDGTKVISNHLKLEPSQARKIKKEFDIDVTSKDTYAEAIEKYTRKIGLKKLNAEQEDLFEELQKMQDKKLTGGTLSVNKQFLADKIKSVEEKKTPKEEQRSKFFDLIFEMQEASKPKNGEDNMRSGGVFYLPKFDLGGEYDAFLEELKAGKINRQDALKRFDYFVNAGYTPAKIRLDKFLLEEAPVKIGSGTFGRPVITDVKLTEEDQKTIDSKWNGNEKAYIDFKLTKEALEKDAEFTDDLFNQYKQVIQSDESYSSEKSRGYKQGLEKRTKKEVLDELLRQEERNARLAAHGFDPKKSEQNIYKGFTNKSAYDFIQKTPGLEDLKEENAFEKGYVGQAAYLAYDQTRRSDKYDDKFQISQTGVSDERGGTPISGIDNANTNTTLGQRLDYLTVQPETELKSPLKPDVKATVAEGTEITDQVKWAPANDFPQLFFQPDQTVLPPSPMEAHLKVDTRLQRLDPVRVGIEQNIQEISNQQQFIAEQLNSIPDNQRASALANLLATSQESTNKAITQANVINAQNQSQTELFNINQAAQEDLYNANNALSFEQRQLTAKAKTEEELRRYYDFNRKVNLNNFYNQQKLNLIDSLFPDYSLDPSGMRFNYDPTNPNAGQIVSNDAQRWIVMNSMNNNQSNV